MPKSTELLTEFQAVFGQKGGDCYPGNFGPSRRAYEICQELMWLSDPKLYDYFVAWDNLSDDNRKPLAIQLCLVNNGQWEAAWALAQLHYDQFLKQEAKAKSRLGKGHPLCNLAIVGRQIGSPTLIRHYATLSSAGDVYMQHQLPVLRHGGFAPTMLEQFESRQHQRAWRNKVESDLTAYTTKRPLYLEAFLASRWFSETYSKHIKSLARIRTTRWKPFVEALLDAVENPGNASTTTTGVRFEAATGLLISATPGFEVDSARSTSDEQVDLVVVYTPERLAQLGLEPGCGLVECKSSVGPVDVSELRSFGAKCLFHRVKFGILVARSGITGSKRDSIFKDRQNAELTRRRFQVDGLTLLVLDISHLRGKSRQLRGLSDDLRADYRELVFGPVP